MIVSLVAGEDENVMIFGSVCPWIACPATKPVPEIIRVDESELNSDVEDFKMGFVAKIVATGTALPELVVGDVLILALN